MDPGVRQDDKRNKEYIFFYTFPAFWDKLCALLTLQVQLMHCPFCQACDTKVIDSRLIRESNQTRRRRECPECKERFTTYESAELSLPRIIKRDGRRAPFSEDKLRAGMLRALEKRPVSVEEVESALARILRKAMTCSEREIGAQAIGEMVMDELRQLDQVAYVRFASVYRSFEDIDAFRKEISELTKNTKQKDTKQYDNREKQSQ